MSASEAKKIQGEAATACQLNYIITFATKFIHVCVYMFV